MHLEVPAWIKYDGLLHGFMGRRGGKSVGPYAGLNVSYRVGDDPKIVNENVCDMKQAVGIHDGRIITMKQIHGDQIIDVKDRNIKEVGVGDGMKTGEKEAFLAILTADCVPILFVAPGEKIVAVVHAGWRGTLAGIAAKMVRLLDSQHGIAPLADLPEEDRYPKWSPDNQWIAFSRRLLNRTQGFAFQFMLYNVQNHVVRQVTHGDNFNDVDYEWSPTGDAVIVQRQQMDATPPSPQLWLYTLKTGQMKRIVSDGLDPQWLP